MDTDQHRQALNGFLARIERRAYAMALFAVGDRDEALDLVQEAMLRLVKHYGDRPEDQWRPLFYRILNNQINDFHRRGKLRNFVRSLFGGHEDEPQGGLVDERELGPAAELARGQTVQGLEQAIRQLPLRQQQAFMLRYWEGLDVRETAQAMGCSEGSVKTHSARATRRLRERLGEHWQ